MVQLDNERKKFETLNTKRDIFDMEKKQRDNPLVEITRLRNTLSYKEDQLKMEKDKCRQAESERNNVTLKLDDQAKRLI